MSFFMFLDKVIDVEILDLLPVGLNGEESAYESRYQDLKNIAPCSRIKICEGIVCKSHR